MLGELARNAFEAADRMHGPRAQFQHLRVQGRLAARRAGRCLGASVCVGPLRLSAAHLGRGLDPVNGSHRDFGDFRHPGLGKTGLEQRLDLAALGCIVYRGILLLRRAFGRPPSEGVPSGSSNLKVLECARVFGTRTPHAPEMGTLDPWCVRATLSAGRAGRAGAGCGPAGRVVRATVVLESYNLGEKTPRRKRAIANVCRPPG